MTKRNISLLQIHYHNRTGGVTRVMTEYADAFMRVTGTRMNRNSIICRNDGAIDTQGAANLIDCPEADYRKFRSVALFTRIRFRLFKALCGYIADARALGDVRICAHNMTLCKNPALVAAVYDCAQKFVCDPRIQFFSIVHDFAEEGRIAELRAIHLLESAGVPLRSYMYASCITQVSVNQRNTELLRDAGCTARLLENPVPEAKNFKVSKIDYGRIDDALAEHARLCGVPWPASKPVVFYPGRVIHRKNVVEAILIACIFGNARLVLGKAGSADQSQSLCDRVMQVCHKLQLPVIMDTEGICAQVLGNKPTWEALFTYANACISTSIAEGFGYALYEPWMRGKCVVGRMPAGVNAKSLLPFDHLYDRLDMPIEFVDADALCKKYQKSAQSCFPAAQWCKTLAGTKKALKNALVDDGTIDFGALDIHHQLLILEHLVQLAADPMAHLPWDGATISKLQKLIRSATASTKMIAQAKKSITCIYGYTRFYQLFARTFISSRIKPPEKSISPLIIEKYFSHPSQYNIMLSAH